jgi:arginyl-tRNA synthetase
MILDIQERLGGVVKEAVLRLFGAQLSTVGFQYPPRPELGDLALTAPFDLAKTLRKPPRQIAEALVAELAKAPDVARAELAGAGYVNVFLRRGAVARELGRRLRHPEPAPAVEGNVIVEHTSINPNKAAHIGHVRNGVLGDTFVRVLKHRGRHVGVQNYIDDTGVQVADVVVGFIHLEKKSLKDVAAITERFD